MKMSRASWMIIAAGAFLILLVGMGLTRSGQIKEQSKANEELRLAETRLNKTQVTSYQTQINELEAQLADTTSMAEEAKERLKQTVVSVDVADKFYEIAAFCGVTVESIGTQPIADFVFNSVNCETTSVTSAVSGNLTNVINFIIGLNDNYATGYVQSVQFTISGETLEATANAAIQMIVYSRKGS
jgi:hypothetical protein